MSDVDTAALRDLLAKANSYPYSIHDSDALAKALVYTAPALLDAAEAVERVEALADEIAAEQGGYGIEFQESQGEFARRMYAALAPQPPEAD